MIAYDAKRAENIVTLVFEALSGSRGSERPHHFRTSTLDAISNASERLKSARFRKYDDDSDPVIKLKRKSDINQNSAQEPTSVQAIQWRGFNPINGESSRSLTHSLYPIPLSEV